MKIHRLIPVVLFALVALLSFSVWAFGGRLFPSEPWMYAGCAIVFFGLGGLSLLPGSGYSGKRAGKFALAFAVAFIGYALIWSVAWFSMPQTFGEVAGSFLGLLVFAAILGKWMRLGVPLLVASAVLFLFHTLGYYTGGFAYAALQGRGPAAMTLPFSPSTVALLAKLSWGLFYGLGLGLGIENLLYLSRQSSERPSTQI